MNVELGIIIALASCIIGIISFVIGQKKTGKDDGMELGQFIGEIKTELTNIKEMINELKSDHKEVDVKIKEAVAEHESRYHSK